MAQPPVSGVSRIALSGTRHGCRVAGVRRRHLLPLARPAGWLGGGIFRYTAAMIVAIGFLFFKGNAVVLYETQVLAIHDPQSHSACLEVRTRVRKGRILWNNTKGRSESCI